LNITWPKHGGVIWEIFNQLGRSVAMGGVSPISAQEIISYQSLRNIRFTAFELDMIEEFDRIAIEYSNKK
jgi:hypothetical protein